MRTKTVTLDDETKAILSRGRWQGGNSFLPDEQLPRPTYVKVDKALKALGGKWNRQAGAHVFSGDASATLRQLLDTGATEIVDTKKTLEQFFTPADLAAELVQFLVGGDLRFAHVLEPSAGDGALIEAAFDAGASYVTAIELDADLAHALQHKWGGHSSPVDIFQGDFLTTELPDRCLPPYAVVLMNPPFSGNKDIDHVMHAWSTCSETVCHGRIPWDELPCREFCNHRAKGCAPGVCRNPYDRDDPRYYLGRGNQNVGGKPFGWAHNMEGEALRAHWKARGRNPLDVTVVFWLSKMRYRINRAYYARKPRMGVRNIRPAAPRPAFTKEQLEHLVELFADANDPTSRAIAATAQAILGKE